MTAIDPQFLLGQRLGHAFANVDLLTRALTHRSAGGNNNERLEFLGDSLVNFIIAEALFLRFPEAREGELSRMRARLVKGATLAEIARRYRIGECLLLGPGEMKSGGHRRESILADALEALLGAIYLDAGVDACRDCVLTWFEEHLDAIQPGEGNKDAKTRLQEWLQSRRQPLPVYRLLETSGEEHEQQFEVACEIASMDVCAIARGASRRVAEQIAAEQAIDQLQQRQ